MSHRNHDRVDAATACAPGAFGSLSVDGLWEWDHQRHVAVYDPGAARYLAGNAALAGRELEAKAATAMIHPADMTWLRERSVRAAHAGGVLLAEYRVFTESGDVRWLLSRGRTDCRSGGPLVTRGILIDITQNRDAGKGYVVSSAERPEHETVMERLASHAVAMKRLIGPSEPSLVALAVDMLLLQIGRELAREQGRSDAPLQ